MLPVALDAGPADIPGRQQVPVGRPVGDMADTAAFHLYGECSKTQGPRFSGWHLKQTSVLNLFHVLRLARFWVPWGVWHSEHFIAPSSTLCRRGKRELPPHLLMAGETELRSLSSSEGFRGRCPVDPVAVSQPTAPSLWAPLRN